MSCMLIAGCGKAADTGSADKLQVAKGFGENKEKSESEKKDAGKKSEDDKADIDLTTQQSIRSYLAGDWSLLDRETGEVYGDLSIEKDGSFAYTRLSDNAQGSGKLCFENTMTKEGEAPDGFRLEFDDCKALVPDNMELYGDEGTGGIFHIGILGDEDYLYLKEIGNGDTVVSMYAFNVDEAPDGFTQWGNNWLFYRGNDKEYNAKIIKDDTFYAWAWEIDDDSDGVWLQPMTEHEYETFDDYSNRKFTGAYFSETEDIGAAYYELTGQTDLDGIVNRSEWDSGYPLMMCEVTTDSKGKIKKITDVDMAFYNIYDMGSLEPDYSYNGTTLTVEGVDIDIREYAPAANAITDCRRVGDWLIVDCHVNPDMGIYLFYNINNGLLDYFEYQIAGANLIWQGDDLSTAVYQHYNDIYDIWGHPIGHIQDGELYELSFKDKNTIVAKCWSVDEIGREKEFTEEFEYEPCDGAVWAYYEYLLGGMRQWRILKELAGDATALVIVNPPEQIINKMPTQIEFEKGALDKVAVIPLVDDAKVTIKSTIPGALPGDKKQEDTEKIYKGRAVLFDVTVSEAMPTAIITVKAKGYDEATWEVMQLSGRIPQMSTFVK